MKDQMHIIMEREIASNAVRSCVLDWISISNNGPISFGETRNPFISNTTDITLA